jgi:hypothetical protein
MTRLGYTRYVAQGGDQGAGVTDAMCRQAPEGLLVVHLNFLDAAPRELTKCDCCDQAAALSRPAPGGLRGVYRIF